ncbi:MAG TPA: hypothetical protein VK850_01485 [Candidatus Binatia bacterium]|nr:hypothetical protein [Candidatus Binatia bacterium]
MNNITNVSNSALSMRLLLATAMMFAWLGATPLTAAPRQDSINIIPIINNISLQGGQLIATGTASVTRNGKTTTVPFTAPVNLALATNQPTAGCPVLNLSLGPIDLNLLGLVVQTSPICLDITAIPGGGLLGDLLCSVANLLNGGLNLDQILGGLGLPGTPGLTTAQIGGLLGGLGDLLNGVLSNLLDATVTDIVDAVAGTCDILHLELGPVDLTLLGLNVMLDDCSGGPVVVDITGQRGRGNLLGNLLCGLIGSGRAGLGATLAQILGSLPGM